MSRGSTTPSLFVADDGREWVVKPSGHTFRDGLVELLASRLAVRLGIPTPSGEVFTVGEGLLAAMTALDGDLRALAEAFTRGGRLAFGSQLRPGADWVPPSRPGADEREALGRIWIFDRWIANADRRPDNPNLILSGRCLLAIDHAQALPWLSGDAPRPAPHLREGLGADESTRHGEAGMRAALLPFAEARRVREALAEVPPAWASADEIDALAETLATRVIALAGEP